MLKLSNQARELEWLLDALRETLASLKSGLEECAVLLSPDHGSKTLVLSSLRSESIKGFATRSGTRVIKGVRMGTLTWSGNKLTESLSGYTS